MKYFVMQPALLLTPFQVLECVAYVRKKVTQKSHLCLQRELCEVLKVSSMSLESALTKTTLKIKNMLEWS